MWYWKAPISRGFSAYLFDCLFLNFVFSVIAQSSESLTLTPTKNGATVWPHWEDRFDGIYLRVSISCSYTIRVSRYFVKPFFSHAKCISACDSYPIHLEGHGRFGRFCRLYVPFVASTKKQLPKLSGLLQVNVLSFTHFPVLLVAK